MGADADGAASAAATDEALMLAYGRGEAAAFERLYARHKAGTWRYFLRHVSGERAVAEELHQDLWLRVIAARDRYEVRAKFATWLYTLARRRLIDHWRARGVAVLDSLEHDGVLEAVENAQVDIEGNDPPLRACLSAEAGHRLVTAVDALPRVQRDALLLHFEAELPLAEIAGLTEAPVETVKSRLRYAYRRLRESLEDLR